MYAPVKPKLKRLSPDYKGWAPGLNEQTYTASGLGQTSQMCGGIAEPLPMLG